MMNLKEICGWESARCSIKSTTYPPSVAGCFKNFLLTGVLKKRFRTRKVVPSGAPTSSKLISFAPSSRIRLPVILSPVLVITSTFATAAILESASPRKPRLEIRSKSEASAILLVAWRKNAVRSCPRSMPPPLSVTRINSMPPSLISTVTAPAPASMAFSTSSFTTLEGRSTTSPAAILSMVSESKICICAIILLVNSLLSLYTCQRFFSLFCSR